MSRHRRRRAYRMRKRMVRHWWRQLYDARGKRAVYEDHCRRTYAPEIFKLAILMLRCEIAFIVALGGRAGRPPKIASATYGGGDGSHPEITIAW